MVLQRLVNRFRAPAGYVVTVAGAGRSFEVARRETLLEGARRAGVALPFDCTVGTCGSCRLKLVAGKVRPILDFAYTLSAAELDAGYVLACQSRVRSDLTIEAPPGANCGPARATFGATVSAIERLAEDVIGLHLTLDRPITYAAGQYAELSIPGIDGGRSYSFARSCPPDGCTAVEFHVRLLPGGAFSGWLADGARVGDGLALSGPAGAFTLRAAPRPLLLVAGGTGLAPILALLDEVAAAPVARAVTLLHGARAEQGLYGAERIAELRASWPAPFDFVPVLSDAAASGSWHGATGLVTDHLAASSAAALLEDADAYLCGPPAMIDAGIERLLALGFDLAHIFYDKFLESSHYGQASPSAKCVTTGAMK